jgi:hypothetical protein
MNRPSAALLLPALGLVYHFSVSADQLHLQRYNTTIWVRTTWPELYYHYFSPPNQGDYRRWELVSRQQQL